MNDLIHLFNVHTFLWVYLAICGLIGLYWIVVCGYEDIRMYRQPWRLAASKFGYNFKSTLSWVIFVALSFPILNIVTGIAFSWIAIRNSLSKGKKDAKSV